MTAKSENAGYGNFAGPGYVGPVEKHLPLGSDCSDCSRGVIEKIHSRLRNSTSFPPGSAERIIYQERIQELIEKECPSCQNYQRAQREN